MGKFNMTSHTSKIRTCKYPEKYQTPRNRIETCLYGNHDSDNAPFYGHLMCVTPRV